ncbi:MAG: DUF4340 domain-containing protein [Myxococcota bacterium]
MNKTTLIAVGVFVGLLVLVLATREKQVSVGIKKLELPAVQKEQVTRLEMTGAKSATLVKDGEAWLVEDPAKPGTRHPADDTAVKSALDAVAEFKAADHVTDKKEKHAELEVDDAKGLRIKVATASGSPLDVVVGKAAKGGGFYMRQAGKDDVFTTKGRLASAVRKDASQWRKRQLFTVKAEELTSVSIKHKEGGELVVESADGKEWKLKDGIAVPEGFRFDPQAAQRVAQGVASLRAQDFMEAGARTDEQLGLSGAHDVVEAKTKDGKSLMVHLGKEGDSKDQSTASQLRGRFDEVDSAGAKDQKITLADLQAFAADATKPEDVRNAATALTEDAGKFARFDVGPYGGGTKDDAITQQELDIASRTASLVPARVEGDPQVYLLPSYTTNQLRKKVTDLRDLALLKLDPEKAKKLTIQAGEKKTVVAKENGTWTVVEPKKLPEGFEYDPQQVTTQLNVLKNMKATRLAEGNPADAVTGLNKPTALVDVELEDGTHQTVRFGKDVTNADKNVKELYVKGSADNLVYVVGDFQRKRLESGVELFKKPKPPPGMAGGMGGMGGMKGLENLPPEVRKQLEAQMRNNPH